MAVPGIARLEAGAMRYTIVAGPQYIKAEMVERDTAEETKEFVHAILETLRKHKPPRVLISIRSSRPVYKVDSWNLSGALDQMVPLKGWPWSPTAGSSPCRRSTSRCWRVSEASTSGPSRPRRKRRNGWSSRRNLLLALSSTLAADCRGVHLEEVLAVYQ
jgi:hypothetical protein